MFFVSLPFTVNLGNMIQSVQSCSERWFVSKFVAGRELIMNDKMTYKQVGVDYDAMDPFKRAAQLAGRKTARNIERLRCAEVEWSRGESVYLVEFPECYKALVEEGLGTKNLVADAAYSLTGKSYYRQIAQDAVAMIVNDMVTLGALPVSTAMHLAVGSSDWFKDERRCQDLIEGWRLACNMARCTWGGGETPTLQNVIYPDRFVLSGSAMGIIKPKDRLIKGNIQEGDTITLINSSGIHANRLTMARRVAGDLPLGYMTKLDDGRTLCETLLDPTHIYVGLIEDCLNAGVDIHYAVNITGHGWRKLMRAVQPFAYVIDELPDQLPIFDFLQKHGPIDDEEAYATFNMGAGFALFIPASDRKKVANIILSYQPFRFGAVHAGYVEKSQGKKVVIRPKGLEYSAETLGLR